MKKLLIATALATLVMPTFAQAQIYFGGDEEHERGEHHDRGPGVRFGWPERHHHEYERHHRHHRHWDDDED